METSLDHGLESSGVRGFNRHASQGAVSVDMYFQLFAGLPSNKGCQRVAPTKPHAHEATIRPSPVDVYLPVLPGDGARLGINIAAHEGSSVTKVNGTRTT